jgi:hypothetical protein
MNIEKIREKAQPGDIILKGSNKFPSPLFRYAQKGLTRNGRPSLYCHGLIYIDRDTVAESTMDFKKYDHETRIIKAAGRLGIGSRFYSGPQYNALDELKNAEYYGLLIKLPLTERQRQDILVAIDAIIRMGVKYSILGLVGSLLSYYVLHTKGNPLARAHTLYCTAFVQAAYLTPNVNIDFDLIRSAYNTSPELIAQFDMPGLRKIRV